MLRTPNSAVQTYDSDSAVRSLSPVRGLPWLAVGLSLPLLYFAASGSDIRREGLILDQALMTMQPAFPGALRINESALLPGTFGTLPPAKRVAEADLTLRVRRGDTLDLLFRREGLNLNDLAEVMKLDPAKRTLHLLRPGDEILVRHREGDILAISRDTDAFNTLRVERQGDQFQARIVPLPHETQRVEASGRITSSLFEAGAEAGISDAAIMKLASIFASEIDFVLDIREGDEFAVIYDEYWRDGRKVSEGDVLAAEFMTQGVRYRAVRYQDSEGRADYFTPEGKSLHKAFVRAPLAFSRVSSGFNPHRMHPILHTIRAHFGTDYAAPTGTPVHAPSNGKVVFRGRKGGYGNVVMLQHPGSITTVYGHLSAFANLTREGRSVKQGEVIGYVGMTGLATAPHLHYEYRVNGVPVNARTVKLPEASPVSAGNRLDFLRACAPLLQRLDARRSLVARSELKSRHNS
jgi:murein DD-endopeptidase MepM/ murein hydrolase activator NlpD